MITDKLIPSPFTFKVDVHALEVGYLVEIEGRVRLGFAPVVRRFALANLTAVDARIHHEASLFMADVNAVRDVAAITPE